MIHNVSLVYRFLEGENMASFYSNSTNQRDDVIPNLYLRGSSQILYPQNIPSKNSQDSFVRGRLNSSSCGVPNFMTSIPNSKYFKAAQRLLDEVVNIRDALKKKADKSQNACGFGGGSRSDAVPPNPEESAVDHSTELPTSERHDLQNRVTKLLAMSDEVDRRYKQYYHQMQLIVSSFDAIAGPQASKLYTTLVLQTISRHFRFLKDAITSHIETTRKKLGEKEISSVGISRLRYIDQQIRQQRAMQHFGLMQSHTWRPQRGLPENSVSTLRAWLFEHFLHPYPKDSEKLMLARQTGLTRGQVANWFINARVRLWKPMIEEMYNQEFGEIEMDSKKEIKLTNEICENINYKLDNVRYNDEYTNLQEQKPHRENCDLLQEALGRQVTEMSNYTNGVAFTLGLHQDVYGSVGLLGREDFEYTNTGTIGGNFVPSHLMHDFAA
ncbi:BEL1-like homeodomain protein 7 isoform X2 [Asparagus officinalis]|nr:BEL1-like homeodomain protein 7 isoform X2 [Asparagus officinalis]XP_020258139.1 BEL1-like homeodomain protein 7 isoform X2 [Asparagus officinalis]